MKVGHWLVEALEDEDGHLTVAFANDDQTKVVCCEEDITNMVKKFVEDELDELSVDDVTVTELEVESENN